MTTKEATDIVNEVCAQQEQKGDHGILRQAINALIPQPDKAAFIAGWQYANSSNPTYATDNPEDAWKQYNGW